MYFFALPIIFSIFAYSIYQNKPIRRKKNMANKRTLKRAIHLISDELYGEAVAISLYGTEAQKANAEAHIWAIAKMEDDFIRRISHIEPGMKPKAYFDYLWEQFGAQVSDIIDQMNG